MDEQKKILVIFTEKADLVLSDIIKKYSLQETDLETFEKYKAGKLPKIVIIDNLTRDFALKIIPEKDLISSLQKELEISQQTAEQISKEIINSLVPLLEKIPEEQLENYESTEGKIPKQEMPISFTEVVEKPPPAEIPATLEEKSAVMPPREPKPRNKKPVTTEIIEEPAPKPKRTKESDKYRETI